LLLNLTFYISGSFFGTDTSNVYLSK